LSAASTPRWRSGLPSAPSRPTLAELRARAHKGHHREIGNWLARCVARPTAIYGTWLAVRLGLSAHQVTTLALLASLAGAALIGTGHRVGFLAGVTLLHLAFWLDRVDGQVARWRGTDSLDGVHFDYWMHHAANLALGFALGFGLPARDGVLAWSAAGAAIASGWTLLALHNDCRYKAVFQRLKRETRSYRVDGGSGGRPAPPPAWPRRGVGLVSWPLLKLCEGHVVLLVLTGLALVAALDRDLWVAAWRAYVAAMAAVAPTLALARLARAVRGGAADREFAAWFRPAGDA
jgi:hypothetical protein